jgi:hypothetical protein
VVVRRAVVERFVAAGLRADAAGLRAVLLLAAVEDFARLDAGARLRLVDDPDDFGCGMESSLLGGRVH